MDRVRFTDGWYGIHNDPLVVPVAEVANPSGEIVFVDAGIQDLQTVLTGVRSGLQVVVLDGTHDALDQIAQALDGQHNLSAIHIISEGQPGQLDFTSGSVTLGNLTTGSHAADLSAISDALGEGGDVMLWGCNVGHGDAGAAFVNAVSHFTNADVAASTDLTGGAGGNWTLETHTGTIETTSPLTTEAQEAFTSDLANTTLTAVQTTTLTTDTDGDGIIDPGEGVTTSVVITNTGAADAANVSFNETLSGMTQQGGFTVTPIAFDDGYSLTGNTPITIAANAGLLVNDVDPDGNHANLTVAAASTGVHATAHGSVNIGADGSFTYTPNTGFEGTDSFTYTVHDEQGLNSDTTGSVTMTVGQDIWYVDSAAAGGGDGSFGHAFQTIAQAAAVDTTNDTIFVSNSGSTYTAAGGIALTDGEQLLGDGSSLTSVNGHTIGASGTNATFSVSGGTAVTLGSGNTVSGLNITGTGAANGIVDNGSSAGTLSLSSVAVNTASGAGISLTHGGTVTATTVAGGSNNSITSTTGTALNVSNTLIGASGLTFQSISANGGTNGIVLSNTGMAAGNGGLTVSGGTIQHTTGDSIVLSGTKAISLSGMNITSSGNGNAANDGSNWIDATNVNGLSLLNVNASHSVGHGVNASSLTNLVIQGGSYVGGGADNDQANFNGFEIHNLLGTSSVTGATFSNSNTIQFHVNNDTATAFGGTPDQLTFSGTTWNTQTGPFAGDHLSVNSDTGGNFSLIVNNTSGQNTFVTGGTAVQATAGGTNGKMTSDISGVTSGGSLASNNFNTAMVVIGETGGGSNTYDIHDNTALGTGSVAIKVTHASASGTSSGKIHNNTITHIAGPGTDTVSVDVQGVGASGGTGTVSIENNTITGNYQRGIHVQSGQGNAVLNATIDNNHLTETDTTGQALQQIAVIAGISGGGSATTTRLNMFSNDVHLGASASDVADYRLQNMTGNTFQLQDFVGNGAMASAVQSWVTTTKGNSAAGSGVITVNVGPGFTAAGGNIPVPLLVALGGVEPDPFTPIDPTHPTDATHPITPPSGLIETHLTQDDINFVLGSAIARWESTGLTAAQDAALHNVSISVGDLSGMVLGSSTPGHITLDANAAGHGWFVDGTLNDDAEFPNNSLGTLYTTPDRTPAGHIDLLTTVMHELGHQLGLVDSYAVQSSGELMYGYIVDGARRLPTAGEANGAIPGSITGEEFAVGPVSVGVLPSGKAVTISWLATIDALINQTIASLLNHGTVSWSNSAGGPVDSATVTTPLDSLTLGDFVFKDTNGNGVQNAGELGVAGVAMTLYADVNNNQTYDAGTDTVVATTTSGAGGAYSFANLAPGNYIVQLNQSNFNAGGPLEGFHATAAGATDPDDDAPTDNNGTAVVTNGVVAQAITLAYNAETTNDGTGHPDINNTLDIGLVSSAPILANAGSPVLYTENAAGSLLEGGITIGELDPSITTLTGATVAISANFTAGDLLNFSDQKGIHGVYAAGTLTLSGSASVADYQTALQSITFSSTSDNPTGTSASRTITWGVDNGGNVNHASNSQTTTVTITPINDAPSLGGAGNTLGYSEQAAAVAVDTGLTVADPDTATLTGATVTITANLQAGDTLHFTNQLGISFVSYAGGVLTLTGAATLANYQTALRSVTFDNATNDDPTAGGTALTRTVTWAVDDGQALNHASIGVTSTINVTAVDDPAVAKADAFTTDEATVLGGGNLFADNGSGADSDPDDPALSIASVAGGAGANVGAQFALTSGALLTVHADGTFSYDPGHAFDSLHLAAPGSGAANTAASDSFSYTLTNGNSATVTLTIDGVNNANTIYQGSGGNDTIAGDATLGGLYHLEQGGNDTVTGGIGSDGFYFQDQFTGADIVHGGGGTNDQIGLEGDYSTGVILDGTAVDGVEVLAMLPGFNYKVSTLDNFVGAAQTFTFWSVSMVSANHVDLDGHLESDGKFQFFLGQGGDIAKGGVGDDLFYGEGGADTLTGGLGADTFAYLAPSDSNGAGGTAYDTIADFTAGSDKIKLAGTAVTAIDGAASGNLSVAGFDTDLAAILGNGKPGELDQGHAVLFTATGGDLNTHTFLIVGTSGAATGYAAGADYVIDLGGAAFAALATTDFV